MTLHYVDSDMLCVKFSTLVVDISALNGKLTTVAEFADQHNINCETNGRLLLVHEMRSDFSYLTELVNCCIEPQGLRYNIAYTFLEEQLTRGVDNRQEVDVIGSELPETQNLDWLSSEITEKGCFIWKTKKEESANLIAESKAIAI